MTEKPRRLGRGLEALITGAQSPSDRNQAPAAPPSELQRIAVASIRPNPFQPRKSFADGELADLEASIRVSGLLQPVTVRHATSGTGYELIAGERRLRAVTRLGWPEVPAIVRDLDDRTVATLALVENLQRSDLNPVEEARGFQRLIQDFHLSHQDVADAVGKDRSTVANLLRLLALPPSVLTMLEGGQLSAGHGRALLTLDGERRQLALAHEILAHHLSVREVERRAREATGAAPKATKGKPAAPSTKGGQPTSPAGAVKHVEEQLRRRLQTDVKVEVTSGEKGSVQISFYSADDLERLLDLIVGGEREAY
ncbi:MAG: hypothetical protein JWO05_1813 [Gemmatimonadetes bacterium]|nr:hypothetical protein [Gemmatimonadota bacterium]